jgi:hypothetical protein
MAQAEIARFIPQAAPLARDAIALNKNGPVKRTGY